MTQRPPIDEEADQELLAKVRVKVQAQLMRWESLSTEDRRETVELMCMASYVAHADDFKTHFIEEIDAHNKAINDKETQRRGATEDDGPGGPRDGGD